MSLPSTYFIFTCAAAIILVWASFSCGENVKISVPPASFAAGCTDKPVVSLTYKAEIEKLGVQGIYLLHRSEYEKIVAAPNIKFDAASLTSNPLQFDYNERLSCLLPPSSSSFSPNQPLYMNSCGGSQNVADSAASPLCIAFLNSGQTGVTATLGVNWRFADGQSSNKVIIAKGKGATSQSKNLESGNGEDQAMFIPTYMVVVACLIALVGVTAIVLLVRNRVNRAEQDMRRYEPQMLASPNFDEKRDLPTSQNFESKFPLPPYYHPQQQQQQQPVHENNPCSGTPSYYPPPPTMHPEPFHSFPPADRYVPHFPLPIPQPEFPYQLHHPQFIPSMPPPHPPTHFAPHPHLDPNSPHLNNS